MDSVDEPRNHTPASRWRDSFRFCRNACARAAKVADPVWSRAKDSAAAKTSVLLLVILFLYAVYGSRQLVAQPGGWLDDGLFLRQAEGIVRWLGAKGQHWLGPYDSALISKPPLFAVWVAFVHFSGVPLPVAEFGLLLALVPLFCGACRPLVTLQGWRCLPITFLLVAIPFFPVETRLLRNAFQTALASGCLIAAAGLALRHKAALREQLRWVGAVGGIFALCYLNREEAIWLLPSIGAATALVVVTVLAGGRRFAALALVATLAGTFSFPVATVAALNAYHYGIFVTALRRAPEFTHAYQVLTSLEPSKHRAFVPIVEETRLRAYLLSPAFAQLRPFLEGPTGDGLARHPIQLAINGAPPDAREFFVSNFEFALRDAAARAGYATAAESEKLFSQIANELGRAIKGGSIEFGAHGPALLAAPRPGNTVAIIAAVGLSLEKLLLVQGVEYPSPAASSGEQPDLQRMADMTHWEMAPTSPPTASALIDWKVRRTAYDFILPFLRVIYPAAFMLLAFGTILSLSRFRRAQTSVRPEFAGLVLLLAPFAWSAALGVVHVMGWPILRFPDYQRMGLVSMSVIATFMTACWMARRGRRHETLGKSNPLPPFQKNPELDPG